MVAIERMWKIASKLFTLKPVMAEEGEFHSTWNGDVAHRDRAALVVRMNMYAGVSLQQFLDGTPCDVVLNN